MVCVPEGAREPGRSSRVLSTGVTVLLPAHLDVVAGVQEQVEALDVPVDDLAGVDVRQAQQGLHRRLSAAVKPSTCYLFRFNPV